MPTAKKKRVNEDIFLLENQVINFAPEPNEIVFTVSIEGKRKTIIKISKEKFYWRGKEVKDTKKVYERFNEWLTMAEHH
jgi:hypothetical protein